MKIDKKIIKELSDYLDEFNLTEIEYSENNVKYKVSKSSKGVVHEQVISTGNQPRSSSSPVITDNVNRANIVKSPMVGTAYLAAEPGAKPFVTIGANIKKGQTIIIIEAMQTDRTPAIELCAQTFEGHRLLQAFSACRSVAPFGKHRARRMMRQ